MSSNMYRLEDGIFAITKTKMVFYEDTNLESKKKKE